jgi:hypothetical protein
MAHEVRVKIDTAVVGNKDLEVIVRSSDRKLGTLLISKGNVEWLPKGNSVNKQRLSWGQFAEFMEGYGKAVKAK